jgi:gliding motility-associated-like protein
MNGTDSDISEILPLTINRNTTFHISTTDDDGCVSQSSLDVNVNVIELYILPEHLPSYLVEMKYEQNLTTNAELPDFSITERQLPNGLTLNSTGLLSGIASVDNKASSVFMVKVEDVNGCTAFREYSFESIALIPKVFTPDNDGINDVFMPGKNVVIFDRPGVIIFEGSNGWDGAYKGKNAHPDIYFYKLSYMENDVLKIKTGYIGIIRR